MLLRSVELSRERMGRDVGDRAFMVFELALAEIGSNVLRYAHPPGSAEPKVEFELRLESETLTALLTDWGPPLHNHLTRPMPAQTSAVGRGLATARNVIADLDNKRRSA